MEMITNSLRCILMYLLVCTEPVVQNLPPNIDRIGCVSVFDLKMLGIKDELVVGSAGQRKLCLCPKNKVNILGVNLQDVSQDAYIVIRRIDQAELPL